MPEFHIWPLMPTLIPAVFGLLLLVFAPAFRRDLGVIWIISVIGMAISLAAPLVMLSKLGNAAGVVESAGYLDLPMVRVDWLALWLDVIFSASGLLALLIMPPYLEKAKAHRPEIYPLTLIAVSGMTAMVSTENLLMIFVGLEVLSISLYVMCGLGRERATQVEASLKYFLLGAFSTAFFVYGIALVLGATGRMDLPGIAAAIADAPTGTLFGPTLLYAGLALILVALAFKVGAVPFHFWAPDVYQGAPTPVTAFMAAGTKAAAFGVLVRVLMSGFSASMEVVATWADAIAVLAVLTMLGGNILALVQTRLKRLLAYSSIAHAGYLLLAIVPVLEGADQGRVLGVPSIVFYLIVYTFMTVGAFAVVSLFQTENEDADHLSHFTGLWSRRPWLAGSMAIFLLSLTGIPPLGGFTGKYVIFLSVLDSGHVGLAAIMAIAAVIGAAYYLRVLMAMFIQSPEQDLSANIRVPGATAVALAIAVIVTIALGIVPSTVYDPLSTVLRASAF